MRKLTLAGEALAIAAKPGKLNRDWLNEIPRCRRFWTLTDEMLAVCMAGETAAVLGR